MSFILDALRKSESERQRDAGLAIARVPLARPRQGVPVWIWIALAGLAATVLALAGGWWQSIRVMRDPNIPPAAALATPGGDTLEPSRVGENAAEDATITGETRPPAAPPSRSIASLPQGRTAVASNPPPGSAAARASGVGPSSNVAPNSNVGPSSNVVPAPAAATRQGLAEPLPTLTELLTRGVELPALTLELHVFSEDPAGRFVFINGGRYAQGQRMPEGPTIVEIRQQGVVLDYSGQQFLLLPQ